MKTHNPAREMVHSIAETVREAVESKTNDMECNTIVENKSRLPVCKTERRQAETDAQQEQSSPLTNDTTQSGTVQGFFTSILPKGAENGIKTPELLRLTGLSDTRTIRKLISDERAAGAVILSGETGYYLPDDGEKGRRETEAFVATVTAKGVNTIRAVRSAKAFLDTLPGQMEIGGGAGATEKGGRAL